MTEHYLNIILAWAFGGALGYIIGALGRRPVKPRQAPVNPPPDEHVNCRSFVNYKPEEPPQKKELIEINLEDFGGGSGSLLLRAAILEALESAEAVKVVSIPGGGGDESGGDFSPLEIFFYEKGFDIERGHDCRDNTNYLIVKE